MNAFFYLAVLLSIVLGLSMTQVLQGYRRLLLADGPVEIYLPPLIWSGLLLVFATQLWWASFGLAGRADWSFAGFAVILLQTVLLYMMSALVLPNVPSGGPVSLKSHYYREAGPFFTVALLMLLVSVAKDAVLEGRLPDTANLGFHVLFAGITILALLVRRSRVHETIAVAMVLLAATYIAMLFNHLRT